MSTLTIVVPCFNEEGCIKKFYDTVEEILKEEDVKLKYIFVDDGSVDKTLEEVKALRENDKKVNYISFSRNCGKEAAMHAGLKGAKGSDMTIIIDADLQHPPTLIKEMIKKYNEGYKIVYTKQDSRKNEGIIRRTWAKAFYSFFNKHADIPMEQSTKDFMLLSSDALEAFLAMPDEYRFTKGILSFVGFKRCCLEFDYIEREVGKSKWNFKKLLKYGVSGLNQFSSFFIIVPKWATIISFLALISSVLLFVFKVFTLESFIIMLIVSLLFMVTNLTLYFVLYVLYSNRRETIKRPLYFIEETSLDE